MRLMLIQRDASRRSALFTALAFTAEDIATEIASGPADALSAARGRRFDCVVIDCDGLGRAATGLVTDLRSIVPRTPIIAVSTSNDPHLVTACFRAGAADFVLTDIALASNALWLRVETAIARAHSIRQNRRRSGRRIISLRRRAETDPLTGLFNRGYADRAIRSDRLHADRRRMTSCVFFDLDWFKAVNDRWGHAAGDDVLKRIARILRAEADSGDVTVRWGGEEFLTLKPSCDACQAWIWAEQVRRRIESERHAGDSPEVAVTVSVGVATTPTARIGDDAIAMADRALYLAKDGGRNRTCSFEMSRVIDVALDIDSDPTLAEAARIPILLRRLGDAVGSVHHVQAVAHGARVRDLALRLGRAVGCEPDDLHALALAAQYHDIGKLGIPESLLAKPGPLDPRERWLVDEHPRFGAEILRAIGLPDRVASIVASHHLRFDAPDACRLTVMGITMAVRILTVAESVVAMLTERPYAARRTVPQAFEELRHERGRQFEPDVVDTLQFLDRSVLCAA